MTTFVISHNLQVQSVHVPSFELNQLEEGLKRHASSINTVEILNHPHWLLSMTSNLSADDFAYELVKAWMALRSELGHHHSHSTLALGGRKDSPATSGSPLQQGFWGVDVVETQDETAFLLSINWEALKGTRPADSVFEVSSLK